MIRTDTFLRSIGFAAAAAIASIAWLVCAAPVLGSRRALGLWLVALAAIYVGGLAGGLARRVAVTMVVATAGLALLVMVPTMHNLVLALAVMVGVGRTACVARSTPLRAVTAEACLLAGGLAFAAMLGAPSVYGVAFGVWGFFLVQSFHSLIPTGGARARPGVDPFEAAHARALALLEP